MNNYIKKIYDMLYSPILTPYNLVENAKLKNYNYVKYYTNSIGVVAEMQCVIPDEGEKVFYYQFDKKDYLQVIYQDSIEKGAIVFNREAEIVAAKEEYYINSALDEKVC